MIIPHPVVPLWCLVVEAATLSVLATRCIYIIADFIVQLFSEDRNHGNPSSS